MFKIYFRISGHLTRFRGKVERDRGENKMENARGRGRAEEAASRGSEAPSGVFLTKKGGILGFGEVQFPQVTLAGVDLLCKETEKIKNSMGKGWESP